MFLISDLDRTLIYSLNSIKTFNTQIPKDLHCVEIYDNKESSFLTKKAYKYCQLLVNHNRFIPATTRTITQFNRLTLFDNKKIPWVIAYNGAVILRNGFIEKEWDKNIKELLKDSLDFFDMETKLFDYIKAPWLMKMKKVGTWFFYFIVDIEKIKQKNYEELSYLAKKNKWVFSKQGRKLYFIPNCLDKAKAASYILDYTQKANYIAAGDSLLDKNLVENAKVGYVPSHGELYQRYKKEKTIKKHIKLLGNRGIYCGEKIMKEATEIFRLSNMGNRKKYV